MIVFTLTLKDRLAEVPAGASFLLRAALNLPDLLRSRPNPIRQRRLPSNDAIAGCLQRHGTVLRPLVPPSRALLLFCRVGRLPLHAEEVPRTCPSSRQIVGIGVEGRQGQRRPSKFQIYAKREHRSRQNAASCRVEVHKHAPSQRQGQKFCCLEREIKRNSIDGDGGVNVSAKSTSGGAQGEKAELLRSGVPSDQKHGKTCVGSEYSPIVEASSDLPPNHACIGWSRCTNLSGTGVCYSDGVVCMAAGGGSMCWRTRPSTCDQRRGSHWLCKWLGVNTR